MSGPRVPTRRILQQRPLQLTSEAKQLSTEDKDFELYRLASILNTWTDRKKFEGSLSISQFMSSEALFNGLKISLESLKDYLNRNDQSVKNILEPDFQLDKLESKRKEATITGNLDYVTENLNKIFTLNEDATKVKNYIQLLIETQKNIINNEEIKDKLLNAPAVATLSYINEMINTTQTTINYINEHIPANLDDFTKSELLKPFEDILKVLKNHKVEKEKAKEIEREKNRLRDEIAIAATNLGAYEATNEDALNTAKGLSDEVKQLKNELKKTTEANQLAIKKLEEEKKKIIEAEILIQRKYDDLDVANERLRASVLTEDSEALAASESTLQKVEKLEKEKKEKEKIIERYNNESKEAKQLIDKLLIDLENAKKALQTNGNDNKEVMTGLFNAQTVVDVLKNELSTHGTILVEPEQLNTRLNIINDKVSATEQTIRNTQKFHILSNQSLLFNNNNNNYNNLNVTNNNTNTIAVLLILLTASMKSVKSKPLIVQQKPIVAQLQIEPTIQPTKSAEDIEQFKMSLAVLDYDKLPKLHDRYHKEGNNQYASIVIDTMNSRAPFPKPFGLAEPIIETTPITSPNAPPPPPFTEPISNPNAPPPPPPSFTTPITNPSAPPITIDKYKIIKPTATIMNSAAAIEAAAEQRRLRAEAKEAKEKSDAAKGIVVSPVPAIVIKDSNPVLEALKKAQAARAGKAAPVIPENKNKETTEQKPIVFTKLKRVTRSDKSAELLAKEEADLAKSKKDAEARSERRAFLTGGPEETEEKEEEFEEEEDSWQNRLRSGFKTVTNAIGITEGRYQYNKQLIEYPDLTDELYLRLLIQAINELGRMKILNKRITAEHERIKDESKSISIPMRIISAEFLFDIYTAKNNKVFHWDKFASGNTVCEMRKLLNTSTDPRIRRIAKKAYYMYNDVIRLLRFKRALIVCHIDMSDTTLARSALESEEFKTVFQTPIQDFTKIESFIRREIFPDIIKLNKKLDLFNDCSNNSCCEGSTDGISCNTTMKHWIKNKKHGPHIYRHYSKLARRKGQGSTAGLIIGLQKEKRNSPEYADLLIKVIRRKIEDIDKRTYKKFEDPQTDAQAQIRKVGPYENTNIKELAQILIKVKYILDERYDGFTAHIVKYYLKDPEGKKFDNLDNYLKFLLLKERFEEASDKTQGPIEIHEIELFFDFFWDETGYVDSDWNSGWLDDMMKKESPDTISKSAEDQLKEKINEYKKLGSAIRYSLATVLLTEYECPPDTMTQNNNNNIVSLGTVITGIHESEKLASWLLSWFEYYNLHRKFRLQHNRITHVLISEKPKYGETQKYEVAKGSERLYESEGEDDDTEFNTGSPTSFTSRESGSSNSPDQLKYSQEDEELARFEIAPEESEYENQNIFGSY